MADKTYRERVQASCREYRPFREINLERATGFYDCSLIATAIASEADAEIAALRLRVAELETDAGRYRWLRKGGYPIGDFTEEAIDDALAALNSKKESE